MTHAIRVLTLIAGSILPAIGHAQRPATDSSAVISAAAAFSAALAAGDSVAALALLTDDVQILESGGIENRTDYRAHHLQADIAYAKSVTTVRTVHNVVIVGDAAWIAGTSITTGQSNGRAVNSQGAELIVLRRTPQGWKIAAIHWSSRARRAPGTPNQDSPEPSILSPRLNHK